MKLFDYSVLVVHEPVHIVPYINIGDKWTVQFIACPTKCGQIWTGWTVLIVIP